MKNTNHEQTPRNKNTDNDQKTRRNSKTPKQQPRRKNQEKDQATTNLKQITNKARTRTIPKQKQILGASTKTQ